MGRLLHTLLAGLVGAGFVHAAVALMLPGAVAERAWAEVSNALPLGRPVRLERAAGPMPAEQSPFLPTALCRVRLSGSLRITAPGHVAGWSLAFFTPEGREAASLNDRMVPDGRLDVVLERAMPEADGAPPPERIAEGPFRLAVEAGEGVLAVRALVPDASWQPRAEQFLSGLSCG